MVCSTARADFPAACAARGGARRTDALARLGALVALLAAWFAQRSPRFALLAPTISLSSLHELGHRSWEVSIIQKSVQRSRNRLGSPRINLLPRSALGQAALPTAVHTVGVRAEHVQLVEAAGAPLRGRVQRIERLSDQYLLHLRLNDTDTELIVSAPPEQLAHAGQEVGIHIVQSLWFDAAGLRVRG